MDKKRLFEKISQPGQLPPLPQVMLNLIRVCDDGQSHVDAVIDIISTDPGLTSQLLQLLGSSYVNLPGGVVSLKNAVVYLGMDTVRNLAISSSAMHFFSKTFSLPNFHMEDFWYRSYRAAVLARNLACEVQLPEAEGFFLAGLLHGVGSLVLMRNFPQKYKGILKENFSRTQVARAEGRIFGVDGLQVSSWLFRHWGLNPIFSEGLSCHRLSRGDLIHSPKAVRVLYLTLTGLSSVEKMGSLAPMVNLSSTRMALILGAVDQEVREISRVIGMDPDRSRMEDRSRVLAPRIKDWALFFGTLEQLLSARDQRSLMTVIQNGFKILFQIHRTAFFFMDSRSRMLVGACPDTDNSLKILNTLALPMDNFESLLVRSLKTKSYLSSLSGDGPLAGSDRRLLAVMKTPGIYMVPLYSARQLLGVVVLGGDARQLGMLAENQGVLSLFSRQVGICLENIQLNRGYARELNEKKMAAHTAMTQRVVHEINNPLSILGSYLENVSLKLPPRHPAQEDLSLVKEEMQRISLLLDGLSRYSHPRIGGFDTVDINRICSRLLDILKPAILGPRNICVHLDLDPELPRIQTDANGVKQVVINLIKNAAEAMGKQGDLRVKTRFIKASAKVLIDEKKRLPGRIEIRIGDSGPGIDPLVMDRLFEPYNTSKENSHNKGLGLAIVHSILKELKGNIHCRSRVGKGTTFIVDLPVDGSQGEG